MAGWSPCGARNSFVHPCMCLSLPGEQLLSVVGMVPVALQWRYVGAQEAAAGSCFSPMQGRCPAPAASDPGALLRARCAGAAVQWVSHRGVEEGVRHWHFVLFGER